MANFCIGFWNDIEDKSLRKTIFQFYQFTVKIISVVPCLKALNSIENLHNLSETNRIENYECFQVVGFEILAKSAKMKKMFENDLGKSRENENRPKNEA